MSTGANGQSYEANHAEHQRLLAEVGKRNEEARQAEAARAAALAEVQQAGPATPPEQIKPLNDELAEREANAAAAAERLASARTAVAALELAAGPEQAGWLEQRLPPEPPKDPDLRETLAEGIRNGVGQINDMALEIKEAAKDMAEIGLIAGRLVTAQPEPADLNLQHETVIEVPRPPSPPELPLDLDQKAAQFARDPSREEERRRVADAMRSAKAYEDALANAPSKGRPDPDPMAVKHEQERQALEERIARQQQQFEDRHDRLNTDPMLIHGMQERLNEQFETERRLQAERQERERLDRQERLQNTPGIER